MSRPPATSRKVGRVLVLLALFLVWLPEPKTSALNTVRCVPAQLQASNADGAGFARSGGRAVSKVGCDVWHGTPKIRKPERGRFLREYGHRTCWSHAGPRREAETERKFCIKLMSCRAEAGRGEAEDSEDVKAKRVCRFGVAFLVLFWRFLRSCPSVFIF